KALVVGAPVQRAPDKGRPAELKVALQARPDGRFGHSSIVRRRVIGLRGICELPRTACAPRSRLSRRPAEGRTHDTVVVTLLELLEGFGSVCLAVANASDARPIVTFVRRAPRRGPVRGGS